MRTAFDCSTLVLALAVLFGFGCEKQSAVPTQPAPTRPASAQPASSWAYAIAGVSARVRGEIERQELVRLASAVSTWPEANPERVIVEALGDRTIWSRIGAMTEWGSTNWRAAVSTWPTADLSYADTRVWGETNAIQWESVLQSRARTWPQGQFPDRYARADFTDQAQFLYMAPDPSLGFKELLRLTDGPEQITYQTPSAVPLLGTTTGTLYGARVIGNPQRDIELLVFSVPNSVATHWILVSGGASGGDTYLVYGGLQPADWPLDAAPDLAKIRTLYPDQYSTYLAGETAKPPG